MKHLTMAEKSLLIGDRAAELIMEYAALLGQNDSADTVEITAYGDDGDPVDVTFLLNGGTSILSESSESPVTEPDNTAAEAYMETRIEAIRSPAPAQPETETGTAEGVNWEP